MNIINQREYTALKTATLNDGHLFIQTPNWWNAPRSIDGPWPASTIRNLVERGMMQKPHDETATITEAGRKAVEEYAK